MKSKETVYPPTIEEKLQALVQTGKKLDFEGVPLYDYAVREVFGEVLMKHWFAGEEDDIEMSTDDILDLYKKAAAISLVDSMVDNGLLDVIESDEQDIVFITEKGKQAYIDGLKELD